MQSEPGSGPGIKDGTNKKRPEGPRSGGCHPQSVPVELQQVVSGGDEAPFRPNGRQASSFEALHPPVRLDLGEDRLDHALSSFVEVVAFLGRHRSSHEVVGPT